MEFSIFSFFYIFIVLAPFIIICAIAMISLFDLGTTGIKGFWFLIGLFPTLLVSIFISRLLGKIYPNLLSASAEKSAVCIATTMTHQDTQFIIPMGQVIISYTFWYFVYCLSVNQFEIANIGLIVFFILLISSDIAWNYYNNCFGLFNSFIAFIIGGAMGATYAAIVDTTSSRKVLYSFSGSNNTESCKVPSKQKFKCSVSEGGRFFQ